MRVTLVGLILTLLGTLGVANGGELRAPDGAVVLTISGDIAHSNNGDRAEFDRHMLEALDWRTVETHTHWTSGPQVFSGTPLQALLDAVGASGRTLTAIALNDYSAELPIQDAQSHDVLLALDHNGKPMRVRNKGPIWIVYPQDERTADAGVHNNKMVWQLRELRVHD